MHYALTAVNSLTLGGLMIHSEAMPTHITASLSASVILNYEFDRLIFTPNCPKWALAPRAFALLSLQTIS
ncbi:hypothetical protein BOO25_16115 [Vibrio navarrensis]|nr:hypothetical protein [Vibrio navarrensis]